MDFRNGMRKYAIHVTVGLLFLAVILALIAPEEKTLGSAIKIIYIHAAVTWIGLASFILSGVLSILYFFTSSKKVVNGERARTKMLSKATGVQLTAIIFWVASVVIGSIAAYLTWGGDWWIEPRLKMAVYILMIAVVLYQLREMTGSETVKAIINLSLPGSVFFLLAVTGKLVHPSNAFAKSDDIQIKIFALLIALVFACVAFVITPLFVSRVGDRARPIANKENKS